MLWACLSVHQSVDHAKFCKQNMVFEIINAHIPIRAQLSKSIVLRLQPVYFFVYFFIKAYAVGTHLNCIDLSMQLNEYPQHKLL